MDRMWNKLLAVLLLFLVQCATNKLSSKDINDMKARFVVEYGKAPDLWPVVVGMEEDVDAIFELPLENSVGMMEYDAIVRLEFEGSNIRLEALIKGEDGVGGGGLYSHCSVFDKEWIAYGQSRGFSLFNIGTRKFIDHIPYPQLEKRITGVCALPDQPFTFLIQIERGNTPDDDRVLQIVKFDLKGNFTTLAELVQVGRHPGERGEPLIVRDNTVFGWTEKTFEAFDFHLKSTQHPLVTYLNNLYDADPKFNICSELVVHPTLPFAIVKELNADESERVWLVRWKHAEEHERRIHMLEPDLPVFSKVKELIVAHFEFSPDGKWLVFRDYSEDYTNPKFICMPVDPNAEFYLGKPKMLGKVMRENAQPVSSAWISKPLSYVVSDGKVLYKWELEKLR